MLDTESLMTYSSPATSASASSRRVGANSGDGGGGVGVGGGAEDAASGAGDGLPKPSSGSGVRFAGWYKKANARKSLSSSWKKYWIKIVVVQTSSLADSAAQARAAAGFVADGAGGGKGGGEDEENDDEQQLVLSYHASNSSSVPLGAMILDQNKTAVILTPDGEDKDDVEGMRWPVIDVKTIDKGGLNLQLLDGRLDNALEWINVINEATDAATSPDAQEAGGATVIFGPESILKAGWLTKTGKRKAASAFSTERKRWFVLTRGGKLLWFTNEQSDSLKSAISLAGATVNTVGEKEVQIVTPEKDYFLAADDTTEAQAWIESLNEAGAAQTVRKAKRGSNGSALTAAASMHISARHGGICEEPDVIQRGSSFKQDRF